MSLDCGKKKSIKGSGVFLLDVAELKQLVQDTYKKEKLSLPSISKANRDQLCELLGKTRSGKKMIEKSISLVKKKPSSSCDSGFGGLKNKNNSCYIDALLLALLHRPINYVSERILTADSNSIKLSDPKIQKLTDRIREDLVMIQSQFKSGQITTCSNLRSLFESYQRASNNYLVAQGKKPNKVMNWTTSQRSPHDVLSYLEKIFHLKGDAVASFQVMGTNQISDQIKAKDLFVSTSENRKVEVIIHIDSFTLQQKQFANEPYEVKNAIDNLTITHFDSNNLFLHKYSNKIEQIKYLTAPMLILSFDRNYLGTKLLTKIKPVSRLTLPGLDPPQTKTHLNLTAIIVHDGKSPNSGHFRAYLKCGTKWYHYDDVGFEKLDYVGSFSKIKDHPNVLSNATQLIYT
jgi:hypothetical protein